MRIPSIQTADAGTGPWSDYGLSTKNKEQPGEPDPAAGPAGRASRPTARPTEGADRGSRERPGHLFRAGELDPGFLHLLIGQEPNERFVVQVDDLDAVAEGVLEIAAKSRNQLEAVFFG